MPTLQIGDRIWVNKWVYGLRFPFDGFRVPFTRTTVWYARERIWDGVLPQRWEVVVFKSSEPEAEHDTLVKRIVALPGEHVSIHDGKVFINGQALDTPPAMAPVRYTSPPPAFTDMRYGLLDDAEHAVVPPDRYLVLGDNSAYSRDGRVFGWLPRENLLGRVACVWWPLGRATDFTGFTRSTLWQIALATMVAALAFRIFVGRVERFADPAGSPGRIWALISFLHLGLRIPFSNRWLLRLPHPQRDQWVAVDAESLGEPPALALGQVLAVPGDTVTWADEVLVNGSATGLAGLPRNDDRYPSSTRLLHSQYLVMVHETRRGRRLTIVDRPAIRGAVIPLRFRRPLSVTADMG